VFGDNSTQKPRQFFHLVTNVASKQRNKIIATVNSHPRVHDAGWMVCGQETLLHPIFVWYLTTVAYFLPSYIVITCIPCVCVYMIFYPFMKAGNCLGTIEGLQDRLPRSNLCNSVMVHPLESYQDQMDGAQVGVGWSLTKLVIYIIWALNHTLTLAGVLASQFWIFSII